MSPKHICGFQARDPECARPTRRGIAINGEKGIHNAQVLYFVCVALCPDPSLFSLRARPLASSLRPGRRSTRKARRIVSYIRTWWGRPQAAVSAPFTSWVFLRLIDGVSRITKFATTPKESIQDCRLEITTHLWERLPTIWNIVEGLAGLKLGDVREVACQIVAGAGDVAGVRRI